MARARGRYARLHCHSCNREWGAVITTVDADLRSLHDIDADECDRCSITHKHRRRCAYAPETCTCSSPHVQIIYSSLGDVVRGVQVRAEQRTAFYRMPDGSISVPSTRDLDDDIAQYAARRGGIRDEAYHLSDLARIHQESRVPRDPHALDHDDFSDRSLVLDWDHQSFVNKDYRRVLDRQLHDEDAARREILIHSQDDGRWDNVPHRTDGLPRFKVIFGGDRYEDAKRRSRG